LQLYLCYIIFPINLTSDHYFNQVVITSCIYDCAKIKNDSEPYSL